MSWQLALGCVTAGLVIAMLTTPVGVSGAVFLLPVQVSFIGVPSPAVTPTNLLFNVVATPGGLLRYRRRGGLASPLTRVLLLGTLPGVVLGAVIRVFAVPGVQVFRLLAAAVLLPLGVWLWVGTLRPAPPRQRPAPSNRAITALSLGVGVVGGIYGIGGGSILGPILVSRGLPVVTVAPAALASTFLTSLTGAGVFAVLDLTGGGDIAPDWPVGLLCGLGGLVGGYVGAVLQPLLPERRLRQLLGTCAIAIATLYVAQTVT
jgi:uncharacterized membrane protein YfcA